MHTGTLLLFFSLALSVFLFVFISITGIFKKDYAKTIDVLFYASGFLITLSVCLLFAAFLGDRFDLSYVYNYSSKDLHPAYKLSGFWAGQEGTFLLWTFLLFVFGALLLRKRDDYTNIVISVILLIQVFILFILVKRSPFEYIWQTYSNISPGRIPADGSGLNPLLQDPWMVVHPPVLFLGYASAGIPYAYAVAALIKKEYSGLLKAYKWILFCAASLGIGIFMGAYWAYKVLGWGGYWGWDPVENSSLLPWLTMIALTHGLIVQKNNNALIKTNIFLACFSLVLVFYGTFLTRSGILSDFSVHSFSDLGLKSYLIFYVIIFLLLGAVLLFARLNDIKSAQLGDKFFTGNNVITYGIIILLLYMVFILFGTSMPILSNIFSQNPAAVNERFYNNISIPFGILILVLLIIAVTIRPPQVKSLKNIIIISGLSLLIGIALNLFYPFNAASYIFTVLGLFIIIQNIIGLIKHKSIKTAGPRLAHIGIGVLIIGIIASNMHSYSIQKTLIKDVEANINSVRLIFTGIERSGTSALKFIYKNKNIGKAIATPYYISKKMNSLVREPYIDYGFFKDVYISPLEYKDNSAEAGSTLITKGEEKLIDGIKIRFIGYDIDKMHMEQGNTKIFVRLNANINGRDFIVTPGLLITDAGNRKNIDAVLPHLNRKVSLLDFNIADKQILLYVEPGKKNALLPESVIVDVSFKRLVWLVWLGTVLISAGIILAIAKARKQKT